MANYNESETLALLKSALSTTVELTERCCLANPKRWGHVEFGCFFAHLCDVATKVDLRLEEIDIERET